MTLVSALIVLAALGLLRLTVVPVVAALAERARARQSPEEECHVAAARLGLKMVRGSLRFRGQYVRYKGQVDGVDVHVQDLPSATAFDASSTGVGLRIVVDTHGRLPRDLVLRGRKAFSDGVPTDDPRFDDHVHVAGPEPEVLACLGEGARQAASVLVREHAGEISDGLLHCDVRGQVLDAGTLVARVRWLVELAAHIMQPGDVPTRLARNARGDSVAGVRLRNLRVLVARWPAHPQTEEACRAALDDRDAEVRMHGALGLGAEGDSVLTALAQDATLAERVTAEAAAHALRRLPAARALDLFDRLAAQDRPDVLAASIGALAERHVAEAEPRLVRLLPSEASSVRSAAAQGLAVSGSAASVASLHAAVAAHPLDLELRRAANAAIAAIQSRVPGAERGQISLADAGRGELSVVAGDEAGKVTLASGDGAAAGRRVPEA